MERDSKFVLSKTTITLHWIVSITMILLLISGLYMVDQKDYSIYPWHKSFGILLFIFATLRIVWRLQNGWPEHSGQYKKLRLLYQKLFITYS